MSTKKTPPRDAKVLANHLAAIEGLRNQLKAIADERAGVEAERERLRKEIETLMRSADFQDDKAVEAIGAKKLRVDLIPNRLNNLLEKEADTVGRLKVAVKACLAPLEAAYREVLESDLKAAHLAVSPFCGDDNDAWKHAGVLPRIRADQAAVDHVIGFGHYEPEMATRAEEVCEFIKRVLKAA